MFRNVIVTDAITLLAGLPAGSVPLILTDPPYATHSLISRHRAPGVRFDEIPGNKRLQNEWLHYAYRAQSDGSAIYIFATWRNFGDWQQEVQQAGYVVQNCIVWDKVNHGMGNLTGGYAFRHEFILYATKGNHVLRGSRPKDVIRHKKVTEQKLIHPYEKPVGLLEFLISKSSDEGNLVIDPFMGSGSTLLAARNLNRQYIGCDIGPDYVKAAKQRLNQPVQHKMMIEDMI